MRLHLHPVPVRRFNELKTVVGILLPVLKALQYMHAKVQATILIVHDQETLLSKTILAI